MGFIGVVEEKVTIEDRDPIVDKATFLRDVLTGYLSRSGLPQQELADASLEGLIVKASEYPLYT